MASVPIGQPHCTELVSCIARIARSWRRNTDPHGICSSKMLYVDNMQISRCRILCVNYVGTLSIRKRPTILAPIIRAQVLYGSTILIPKNRVQGLCIARYIRDFYVAPLRVVSAHLHFAKICIYIFNREKNWKFYWKGES